MKRLMIILVAVCSLAVVVGCNQPAKDGTKAPAAASGPKKLTEDQIIAWVNNTPIPKKEVDDMIEQMPPYMQMQLKAGPGLKKVAENLVGVELVYQKATKDGMLNTPEMKEKLQMVTKQIVFAEYMKNAAKDLKAPDEAAAKKFYDETPALAGQKYEEVKERIMQHLMQQAQQEAITKTVDALKATATVKFNEKLLGAAEQANPFAGMQMPGGAMPPEAMGQGAPAPAAPAAPAKKADEKKAGDKKADDKKGGEKKGK